MHADPFRTYLGDIEKALSAGDATEHTHRPALKALIESLAPHVTATNERDAPRAAPRTSR